MLSEKLIEVCEEFRDPDSNVLVYHLRQAVIDIPASIAADLHAKRWATMDPVIKLSAELQLVHTIYPAIDTGNAEELLNRLITRMQSERFNEREPEPEPEHDEEPQIQTEGSAQVEAAPQPAAGTVVIPHVDGVVSIHPQHYDGGQ